MPDSADGLAYVETINLDGESNLKIKKALDQTQSITLDTMQYFTVTCIASWPLHHAADSFCLLVTIGLFAAFPGLMFVSLCHCILHLNKVLHTSASESAMFRPSQLCVYTILQPAAPHTTAVKSFTGKRALMF